MALSVVGSALSCGRPDTTMRGLAHRRARAARRSSTRWRSASWQPPTTKPKRNHASTRTIPKTPPKAPPVTAYPTKKTTRNTYSAQRKLTNATAMHQALSRCKHACVASTQRCDRSCRSTIAGGSVRDGATRQLTAANANACTANKACPDRIQQGSRGHGSRGSLS